MPLDKGFALSQVRRLTLLKYFPQNIEAIDALVELLCEWCQGDERESPEQQCKALVAEVLRTWDEWRGPSALREVLRDEHPVPYWTGHHCKVEAA